MHFSFGSRLIDQLLETKTGSRQDMMNKNMMNKRLASIGCQGKERGGAGNCFYSSAGAEVGMSGSVLREKIAEYLKCSRDENEKFICEPYEEFCKGVATNGTWVNGGPEVFAAPKVLDRDILILGCDPAHDLFLGTRGTEPIILVYWEAEKHFTGVEIIENSWRKVAPKAIMMLNKLASRAALWPLELHLGLKRVDLMKIQTSCT